jgi:hypothetical protein
MSSVARSTHAHAREESHPSVRHLGRCTVCLAPVNGAQTVVWLNGELYHRDCARYRSGRYVRHAQSE